MLGAIRISVRTIFLVSLASAMLAVAAYRYFPSSRLIARRLDSATVAVPDEDVPRHLQQLRLLGDEGLRSLVRAIGSEREEVSQSATRIVHEQLEDWREIPSDQSSPRVLALATLLAQNVDAFDVTARRNAAQIANKILLWPIDRNVVDGSEIVDHCARVLEARAETRSVEDAELAIADLGIPQVPLAELGADATGSTSPDPIGQRLPDSLTAMSPPMMETQSTPSAGPPFEFISEPVPSSPPAREQRGIVPRTTIKVPVSIERRPAVQAIPSTETQQAPQPPDMASLSDLDVMRTLHSPVPELAALAENELAARGFRQIDIQLSRRLVSPDPKVRLELVRILPSLNAVDARAWLLQLARDKDVSVRRAATSVLATSNDPQIREQLRELEREETDPEVLRQVRRALDPTSR